MMFATRTARIRSRTILGRLSLQKQECYPIKTAVVPRRTFATSSSQSVDDSSAKPPTMTPHGGAVPPPAVEGIPVTITPAANAVLATNVDDDDEGMEQEEMFVEAHESFAHDKREWGGPRRGGRLPEPTRFGDWERKGRCSDF